MKISKFTATGVHGHLNLSINFNSDYTFLIGVNGSGKTSALRLMMDLLTPDLADLVSLPFEQASISVLDAFGERAIVAERTSEDLRISVEGISEPLNLNAAEQALLSQPRNADEGVSPVLVKASESGVYKFILSLGTPMFLGLDRRFVGEPFREPSEMRRREFLYRRSMKDEVVIKRGNVAAGLSDVNILVQDTMSEVRQKQEELDAEFRNRLLASAFSFEPVGFEKMQPPSRAAINQYREKRDDIEAAVKSLQIPLSTFRTALDDFFESMDQIASDLEQAVRVPPKATEERGGGKKSRKYGAHEPPKPPTEVANQRKMVEWVINKPQVDRITAHLELLATYSSKRDAFREPIDRFLTLLNSFLVDTNKRAIVNERGLLQVAIGKGEPRSIGSLSSGERQLVVMLGHLTLNKQLAGSGIFVVDEPELSLHISWQERFVEAIRQANPSVQIVMATHSPAIILDRDEHCESLDAGDAL